MTAEGQETALDGLLTAWAAWDATPGHQGRADAMEASCKRFASWVGLPTAAVRDLLSAYLRCGFTRKQAANAVELVQRSKWELQ
jgi:hypothetical protein